MLLWTNLNSEVLVKATTKKFYNKYLNKIVVFCPGARVIPDKRTTQSIQDALKIRRERIDYLKKVYNHQYIQSYRLDEADVYQIEELAKIKQAGVKVRIEEPYVSLYHDDAAVLYNAAKSLTGKRLTEVHMPENTSAKDILNRGEIVTKSDVEFPFKIMLKEQWNMGKDTKRALLDYLYNLGDDDVCLTKSLVKNLGDNHRQWFPAGYFYAKDDRVATFIGLIAPGIVSGIFKLSKLDQ